MGALARIQGAWAALRGKAAPSVGIGGMGPGYGLGHGVPNPTRLDLIAQNREFVYACAMLNASAVCNVPLRLYATTRTGQAKPRCEVRPVERRQLAWLKENKALRRKLDLSVEVHEVVAHPLLDFLERGNAHMTGYATSELLQFYQEIEGNAFMYLERGPLGTPIAPWVLPSHVMQTMRGTDGLPVCYMYGTGTAKRSYTLDQVIAFRMPNLRDPYAEGYSPLRAAWSSANLAVDNSDYTREALDQRGWFNALVTPKEQIGSEEADRMRASIRKMAILGKRGGPMVTETPFDIKTLLAQIDIRVLFDMSKETIANAYGVPLSMVTTNTNLANNTASRQHHALLAVLPRCRRLEAKLNAELTPLYDDRLFLAFDNPVPEDRTVKTTERTNNLKSGVTTINEERADDMREPVPWGDKPWMSTNLVEGGIKPSDVQPNKEAVGRVKPDKTKPDKTKPVEDEPKKLFASLSAFYMTGEPLPSAKFATLAMTRKGVSEPACCHHEARTLAPSTEWHKKASVDGHQRQLPEGAQLRKFLKATFRQQREEVLNRVLAKIVQPKAVYQGDIDLSGWDEILAAGATPFISIDLLKGAQDAAARLGADLNISITMPKVKEAIAKLALKFSEETNETTSLSVNEAIAQVRDALQANLLTEEGAAVSLSQRIADIFDTAEKYRAERIALTESSRALHVGQRMSAIESGVVKGFKWLCSADACDECKQIAADHADGIDLNGHFSVKGDGPYDIVDEPPLHPYCMCTMTEILDEQSED